MSEGLSIEQLAKDETIEVEVKLRLVAGLIGPTTIANHLKKEAMMASVGITEVNPVTQFAYAALLFLFPEMFNSERSET